MKNILIRITTFIIDAISLIFSLPGALLIMIGGLLSDWSESLKHL